MIMLSLLGISILSLFACFQNVLQKYEEQIDTEHKLNTITFIKCLVLPS